MNAPPSVQLGEGTASHIKDAKYLFLSRRLLRWGNNQYQKL